MLWLSRFTSPILRPHVALALTLIAAAACADRDATAPQRAATQRASQDIDPTKNPGGYPPSLSVSPSSLTFGQQAPNTTSTPQTVTVLNTDELTVSINQLTFDGPYQQTGGNCLGAFLAPGGSCTIAISYAPTTGAGLNGSLMISHSGHVSPTWVTLNGTPTPWADITPTAIGFGSVTVGLITSGRVVKIKNTGNAASFVVSSLTLGGANPYDFLISNDGCTGATLAPGSSCTAYVSFEPLAIGTRSATIAIAHNAAGGPSAVSLSGTGTKPAGGYIP